jgi:asparagine synthase (glutamine-hydrolysing)
MCGIIGYVSTSRRQDVERRLDLLAHRGPDGRGEVAGIAGGRAYWLGHRRLSIIDVEGGAQPLVKHGLAITYNGEIYNYVELVRELTAEHGVSFRTRCDTEVLLEAFRVWGPDCLDRLNGMFAFAILDIATGDLFCARDRLGKKPFYYTSSRDGFFFASEPAPLLPTLPRVRADNSTLVAYLLGARAPASKSFFAGVSSLGAGHWLRLSVDSLEPRLHRYWSPHRETRESLSFEDAAQELHRLFVDAVAVRLRSDVGFAVAASGGLDSTIVLAAAARRSAEPIRTVSVTFDEAFAWDETKFIESLGEQYSIKPVHVESSATMTLEAMLADAKQVVSSIGEPTPYTSVPYVLKLYEATAKAGIKVLLEGQGADELFGGYTHFVALQRFAFARRWIGARDYLLALRRRSRVARRAYYGLNTLYPFLTKQARELMEMPNLTPSLGGALIDAQDNTVLPGLLQYSDRLAMRFGVEVRLPFLDYRLVEFVNSLPDDFKVRGSETKRILRGAFSNDIPAAIRERTKIGFGSPTTNVLRTHYGALVEQFVQNGAFANSPLFQNGWRRAVRSGFLRTLPSVERVLWRFILVDYWMQEYGAEVAA